MKWNICSKSRHPSIFLSASLEEGRGLAGASSSCLRAMGGAHPQTRRGGGGQSHRDKQTFTLTIAVNHNPGVIDILNHTIESVAKNPKK